MTGGSNGAGVLRRALECAAAETGQSMTGLTVLAPQRDPYRLDTPAGHRDGDWFAEQLQTLLAPEETVHLRGLHYRIASAGGIIRPDGLPYENTEEAWTWLSDTAAKAARWLGYVPFERIVDERNAAPELFVAAAEAPYTVLSQGMAAEIPDDIDIALPSLIPMGGFVARQPYRIVLVGEKVSLRPVLLPIAELVGGELLLPTGEASDTMIAELAARCAADGRPSAVLYFSDFDPAGRQMAVSVSRKLQALRALLHPELNIQLHPVALTLEQVRTLELPSAPLKDTERRADRWRQVMGHEQTEIDALAALNLAALTEITMTAIRPFYDPTLERRTTAAYGAWLERARIAMESHPAYWIAREAVGGALEQLESAALVFASAQQAAHAALLDIEAPSINAPEPELAVDPPQPLYTSADDYVAATNRLISHKALETYE